MFILPFILFAVNAAVLCLIVRWITGEQTVEFRISLIWIAICWVLGKAAEWIAGTHAIGLPVPAPEVLQLVVSVGALAVILWHEGIRLAHVWTIIGMYFVVQLGLFFVLVIVRTA